MSWGLSLPLLQWLPAYRREWLRPDLVAGVTTAAVVIPKALAYATIAGLPIQVGLYTAFVPLIVYAMLGSSRPMSVTTTTTTTIAILTGAAGETMNESSSKEAGTIQVLLKRLNDIRLPRALELKKKVERGEKLDSYDLEFLETVLADATSAQGLVAKHPEFKSLVSKLTGLYSEITTQGLENEQKKG